MLNDLSSITLSRLYPDITIMIPGYGNTVNDIQSIIFDHAVTRYSRSIGIIVNDNFICTLLKYSNII